MLPEFCFPNCPVYDQIIFSPFSDTVALIFEQGFLRINSHFLYTTLKYAGRYGQNLSSDDISLRYKQLKTMRLNILPLILVNT